MSLLSHFSGQKVTFWVTFRVTLEETPKVTFSVTFELLLFFRCFGASRRSAVSQCYSLICFWPAILFLALDALGNKQAADEKHPKRYTVIQDVKFLGGRFGYFFFFFFGWGGGDGEKGEGVWAGGGGVSLCMGTEWPGTAGSNRSTMWDLLHSLT